MYNQLPFGPAEGRKKRLKVKRKNHASAENDSGKRADLYVRMSTDHQKYSVDNQETTILTYAVVNSCIIVRRYVDPGKSGLGLEGRNALRSLIDDAQTGRIYSSTLLVYDASR